MFSQHLLALPDVVRDAAANGFLITLILMIIFIRCGRAAIDADQTIFRVVGVAVYAIISHIACRIIAIIQRRAAVGYAGDAVGWHAAALLQGDALNLIRSFEVVVNRRAISPAVVIIDTLCALPVRRLRGSG